MKLTRKFIGKIWFLTIPGMLVAIACFVFLSGCGVVSIHNAIKVKDYDKIEKIANKNKDDQGFYNFILLNLLNSCGDNKAVAAFISGEFSFLTKDLRNNSYLMIACNSGCYESAKLLIDKGADVEALQDDGWTPLLLATNSMPAEIKWEWPNKLGPNPTGVWKPPVGHDTSGKPEIAMYLIDKVKNVDQQGYNGMTPLMMACQSGYDIIVRTLLEKGADIEKVDTSQGWTPLMFAISSNRIEITKILLDTGANIDVLDLEQRSPLMIAASNANLEISSVLIKMGAKVNFKNDGNLTALAIASSQEDLSVFQLLLSNGAELVSMGEAPFINGKLHLNYAKFNDNLASEKKKMCIKIAAESFQKANEQIKLMHADLLDRKEKMTAEKDAEMLGAFLGGLAGNLAGNYLGQKVFDTNAVHIASPNYGSISSKYDFTSFEKAIENCEKLIDDCQKSKEECDELIGNQ